MITPLVSHELSHHRLFPGWIQPTLDGFFDTPNTQTLIPFATQPSA
jgi:hypothetical protein